ncbi:Protein phosphatase 1 regulatory subunit 15A [Operophtera brumata]|uniref:Protein phosphatase 1 regulatory subunit 15A n=1 Tax=Operophtera brumata TaxID=104452 RepID=A0A0L7L8D2_OPEBR|nr:Protein phosphatase 1 regulatory subunit 15A [Operophtera brumata]
MMYSLVNGRNQRHKTQMYNPMNHSYANYCVEALQKSEMKIDYENEIFLNNLHLIPDPLKKNLADTLITDEKPEKLKKSSLESPKMPPQEEVRHDSALAGITNFFSGVISMLSGAMFRSRSPVNYDDCFDANSRQGSPSAWRRANIDEDKNGQAVDRLSSDATSPNVFLSDMNNCKTVHTCEEKLNQVRYLLTPKPVNKSNPIWLRKRPKKVFVEPGSVEDSFEDAFSPEDFVTLSNDPYIEYYSPPQYQSEEMCATEAPKTKIEVRPIKETTNIVKDITENETGKLNVEKDDKNPESDKLENDNNTKEDSVDNKHQLVSSCEDKLSKLKALLQDKRKKHTEADPTPEPTTEQPRPAKTIPINKPKDKHYKNPHRMLDKRQKMKMNRSIQDDVIFANEIDIESTDNSPTVNSSSDTSLGDYFDEMKGRFRSISNTESEDSFQIVFNDSPKLYRKASDCESEDSFIVFEDNDNCYTSNEVFGDSDCDSDSDVSDSGCSTMTCKLSHSLSRTVSNLTDDTLYESSDEVDCGRVEPVVEAKGLLMDTYKKSLRKDQPSKKVSVL